MILSLELYQTVYATIAHHYYSESNYSSMVGSEDILRKHIATLAEINLVCLATKQAIKFRNEFGSVIIERYRTAINNWRFHDIQTNTCSLVQLVKHLQCIGFHIDRFYMKHKKVWKPEYDESYEWLQDTIFIIFSGIVMETEEYQSALWGTTPAPKPITDRTKSPALIDDKDVLTDFSQMFHGGDCVVTRTPSGRRIEYFTLHQCLCKLSYSMGCNQFFLTIVEGGGLDKDRCQHRLDEIIQDFSSQNGASELHIEKVATHIYAFYKIQTKQQ